MRFGKIRIEDGCLRFYRVMKPHHLPVESLLWAYGWSEEQAVSDAKADHDGLVVWTNQKRRYQFDMTGREVQDCLACLKQENPALLVGMPDKRAVFAGNLWNTRDLGGQRTAEGKWILPRQLLRSASLYRLSEDETAMLQIVCHLSCIVDFRTGAERAKKEDVLFDGVQVRQLPLLEETPYGNFLEMDLERVLSEKRLAPKEFMKNMYRCLVLDAECRHQYAEFFEILLENERGHSVLWHCSDGKDRTAIVSMLLLYVLGVSKADIIQDYMFTNECLKKDWEYISRLLEGRGLSSGDAEKLRPLFSVSETYLQSAVSGILSEYGTFERYMRKALCLTPAGILRLKERYLV